MSNTRDDARKYYKSFYSEYYTKYFKEHPEQIFRTADDPNGVRFINSYINSAIGNAIRQIEEKEEKEEKGSAK